MGLSGLRGLSVYVKMFIDNTDVGNSNSDSKRGVSPLVKLTEFPFIVMAFVGYLVGIGFDVE